MNKRGGDRKTVKNFDGGRALTSAARIPPFLPAGPVPESHVAVGPGVGRDGARAGRIKRAARPRINSDNKTGPRIYCYPRARFSFSRAGGGRGIV